MASRLATVEFIVEQAADAGVMSARKMFGEYALYRDGKLVGLVCDDELFVKPTVAGRAYAGNLKERSPYPGAKPSFVVAGQWESSDWLSGLIRRTAEELPLPVPKQAKRPKAP